MPRLSKRRRAALQRAALARQRKSELVKARREDSGSEDDYEGADDLDASTGLDESQDGGSGAMSDDGAGDGEASSVAASRERSRRAAGSQLAGAEEDESVAEGFDEEMNEDSQAGMQAGRGRSATTGSGGEGEDDDEGGDGDNDGGDEDEDEDEDDDGTAGFQVPKYDAKDKELQVRRTRGGVYSGRSSSRRSAAKRSKATRGGRLVRARTLSRARQRKTRVRQSSAYKHVSVVFDLSGDPALTYCLSRVADSGPDFEEWTSFRLKSFTLFVETRKERLQISREAELSADGFDLYRVDRVEQPQTLGLGETLVRGIPLREPAVATLHRRLDWRQLQWSNTGLTIDSGSATPSTFTLVNVRFRQNASVAAVLAQQAKGLLAAPALGTESVQDLVRDLRSGRLAPPEALRLLEPELADKVADQLQVASASSPSVVTTTPASEAAVKPADAAAAAPAAVAAGGGDEAAATAAAVQKGEEEEEEAAEGGVAPAPNPKRRRRGSTSSNSGTSSRSGPRRRARSRR